MKKLLKMKILFIIFIFFLIFSTVTVAHSGRTDSNGGHKDKNNVSGLGGYHYHCGGHPAHLHPNGVCPYNSNSKTSNEKSDSPPKKTNNSNKSSKNKSTTSQSTDSKNATSAEKKEEVTEQNGENERNVEKDIMCGIAATGLTGFVGYQIYKNKKK